MLTCLFRDLTKQRKTTHQMRFLPGIDMLQAIRESEAEIMSRFGAHFNFRIGMHTVERFREWLGNKICLRYLGGTQ